MVHMEIHKRARILTGDIFLFCLSVTKLNAFSKVHALIVYSIFLIFSRILQLENSIVAG
jgi:hypothetical protein